MAPPPGLEGIPVAVKNGFSVASGDLASTCATMSHDLLEPLPGFVASEEATSDDENSASQEAKTTLMVRNIPIEYTQDMLIQEWPIDGTYDFLYVPRSSGGKSLLGYAFINFISQAHANAFREQWHCTTLKHFSPEKCLSVSFADVQGFEANIAQLKKKRVFRIRCRHSRPIVLRNGKEVDPSEL